MPLGKRIDVRLEQKQNDEPISETPSGMIIEVNLLQFQNASSDISRVPSNTVYSPLMVVSTASKHPSLYRALPVQLSLFV